VAVQGSVAFEVLSLPPRRIGRRVFRRRRRRRVQRTGKTLPDVKLGIWLNSAELCVEALRTLRSPFSLLLPRERQRGRERSSSRAGAHRSATSERHYLEYFELSECCCRWVVVVGVVVVIVDVGEGRGDETEIGEAGLEASRTVYISVAGSSALFLWVSWDLPDCRLPSPELISRRSFGVLVLGPLLCRFGRSISSLGGASKASRSASRCSDRSLDVPLQLLGGTSSFRSQTSELNCSAPRRAPTRKACVL